MNDRDTERAGPMLNPPHLGELVRESMEATGNLSLRVNTSLGSG